MFRNIHQSINLKSQVNNRAASLCVCSTKRKQGKVDWFVDKNRHKICTVYTYRTVAVHTDFLHAAAGAPKKVLVML
jgi:hypothetical protein